MRDARQKSIGGPQFRNKYLSISQAPHKEVVKIYTSKPCSEIRTYGKDKNPVYDGDVNVLLIIDGNYDIMCCKYTQDNREVAAGFGDGLIRTFDVATGLCTHTLVDEECIAYPGAVTAIKHRPKLSDAQPTSHNLLASYVNGCIKCWKYKNEQCLYTIREKRQALGICYHPRRSKFITYGDDAKLNLYDEESQTQERSFFQNPRSKERSGHRSRIFACIYNPKSNHELVSGGWDDNIMCWDDRQPHATRYFSGVHIVGEGIDFDKTGKTIVTCAWQEKNCIQIWDYGSGRLIQSIEPDAYASKLYCGRLAPRTNLLVCGGNEGNILRVVDISLKVTECTIRFNPGSVLGFDFGNIRRKPARIEKTFKRPSEIKRVPRVAYVTGKRLQIVDFG